MKIKSCDKSYEEVLKIKKEEHRTPKKQSAFFRFLLKTLSAGELKKVGFTHTEKGMDKLKDGEPVLYLMNHSSFIDLKIAATLISPRPFSIVCTSDGFVGKKGLMYGLGCIPTKKFIMDTTLVYDMVHVVRKLNQSILMYPEASYSFDGTATDLPESLGKCLKLLKVPVVMIRTHGAFLRDPLYNMLQIRDVNVTAEMKYVLSPEDIKNKSVADLNKILKKEFTFDNFAEQRDRRISVAEPFRADGLNRVLYKCPVCGKEGRMEGKGTELTCHACGKVWTMTEYGELEAADADPVFTHIPDWYKWERSEVRKEIEKGTYKLDIPVDIRMMVNMDTLYHIGEGHLTHDKNGFNLTGADGKLDYTHSPKESYSLYSDYYWYEIGDMICIGNHDALYYCFPIDAGDVVAKTRLAAEELYKIQK